MKSNLPIQVEYLPVYRAPQARRERWVLRLSFVVIGVFIAWAAWAKLDQVAHARGQVIAAARTQVIQAPDGGILKELMVSEGDRVTKGQLLAVMEKDRVEAAVRDTRAKVAALRITLTRLRAEVYGGALVFHRDLRQYEEFVTAQTELYRKRQQAIQHDVQSLEEALALAMEELAVNEQLVKSGDIGRTEVLRLRRQVVDIKSQIASRRNKYFQDAQAEMSKAEEDLSTQEQSLAERTALAEHTELRAPTDGVVKNVQVTTRGGVVRAGDTVLELLPTSGELLIEAKLSPTDLGQLRTGLPASVKLDAYDYAIYGALQGEVSYISPDTLVERTAQGEVPYYRIQVRIGEKELKTQRGGDLVAVPGMTVGVDIRTGERTVLEYLTKPVTKTLTGALRER